MENAQNDYSSFLQKIMTISSKINEDQQKILEKIISLEKRLSNIENKIEKTSVIAIQQANNFENYIDIRRMELEKIISVEDSLKAMSYKDYRSVMVLFKKYYKNNEGVYPIKLVGKRSYEFFLNNKWNSDIYGHYIMNTLCYNFQNLFIEYNKIGENDINENEFVLNQQFIYKLSEEKYKKEIFRHIIEEIRNI